MKKFALILLTILISAEILHAQDVIQLSDGKEKKGYIDRIGSERIFYRKKEGGRMHYVDKENAFRIIKAKGDTVYIYEQDSLQENEYSIAQFERNILGQQEARKYYKPWRHAAAGFCVGGASAFLGLYWSFLPPAIYTSFIGVREVNSAYFVVSDEVYLSDEYYLDGYEISARAIRIKYTVVGALTGLATSITLLQFVIPTNSPE